MITRKKSSPPPTPEPEELVGMFFRRVHPPHPRSLANLPYIKGIIEPLSRILKRHDITITSRPIKALPEEFPVPKFRPSKEAQRRTM